MHFSRESLAERTVSANVERFTLSELGGIYSICTHQTASLICFEKRLEHIYQSTFEFNKWKAMIAEKYVLFIRTKHKNVFME